ncbi:glycoside hydrolase family 2 protein [Nocardioides ochotonae]|uniref:glycoside hydrolase family 2 protein n=1 Tax=Nocardioides ochotonae TaxID=2685869 RepID=UPI001CD5F38C|nr:glycoside hydrolase family 2 TIM barrel-domain containing protein [Nocardioides ochotonae]
MSPPQTDPLLTRWGRALDRDHPLPEHPRPQLVRPRWHNLNGRWSHAIVPTPLEGPVPDAWDGEIVVPFSPEAPLSGAARGPGADETLWYDRTLTLPVAVRPGPGERVLLHLGAVDQECRVLAGPPGAEPVEVGAHVGGYLPFSCDVTDALAADGSVRLLVAVRDRTEAVPLTRGKQRTARGGIWYTPHSGIWQTVWVETVPATHVARLDLVPHLVASDPAASTVEVTVHAAAGSDSDASAEVEVLAEGAVVARGAARPGVPLRLAVPDARPWSPEDPFLYDVRVRLGAGETADEVTSYVGMRSVGIGPGPDGRPRLLLNGAPYFHAGVLDQGYWPDGLCTPPSDEAMVHDITEMKRLGFTMLRKHIKVEPMRWYAHCDRIGMLVWQDAVNGGGAYRGEVVTAPAVAPFVHHRDTGRRAHARFAREDAAGRAGFEAELRAMVEHLRSVPSIVAWVPFNEGWGQFDAVRIAAEVRLLDPTRIIDHASGWHDQGAGDLRSLHVYFRRFRTPRSVRLRREPRVLALTEYGGYALPVPGHVWGERTFGYRRMRTTEDLLAAFERLHDDQLVPAARQGLAAIVYTQVSDVEDELNGLLTYDREVTKLPAERVRAVLDRLRAAAASAGA